VAREPKDPIAIEQAIDLADDLAMLATPIREAGRGEAALAKDDFFAGICVALQIITSMDNSVLWDEVVRAAGQERLLQYATFTEPDEWELAGFQKYARRLGFKKPTSRWMVR